MAAFLFLTLAFLLTMGIIIYAIVRFLQKDTYEYDMMFIWDRYPATLEGMGFKRSPKSDVSLRS
ncbi:MAG: hypothetical protein K0Q59_3191 [Paenibacillus sp.]|jgi:hypothetical protein|nr:hypothetical protein [Paenibacillus sp.]